MKNLNTASKVILLIGLLAFVASGILLPWKNKNEPLGYGFIWAPAAKEYTVFSWNGQNVYDEGVHDEGPSLNDMPTPWIIQQFRRDHPDSTAGYTDEQIAAVLTARDPTLAHRSPEIKRYAAKHIREKGKPQLVRDRKGVVVDTTLLLIQWAVIFAVTAGGIVFSQLAGGRKDPEA